MLRSLDLRVDVVVAEIRVGRGFERAAVVAAIPRLVDEVELAVVRAREVDLARGQLPEAELSADREGFGRCSRPELTKGVRGGSATSSPPCGMSKM